MADLTKKWWPVAYTQPQDLYFRLKHYSVWYMQSEVKLVLVYGMKAFVDVEVWLHPFLKLALDGDGQFHALCFFTSGGKVPRG
jgi:hypothetical protein